MATKFAQLGFIIAAGLGGSAALACCQPTEAAPTTQGPETAPSQPTAPVTGTLPEVDLQFTDGKVISGQLVERTAKELILRIAGVNTRFPVAEIMEVRARPPIEAQYRTLRDSIDNNDTERLLQLANWLFQKKKYDLALAEVDHVLTIDPGHPGATELRTLVAAQRAVLEAQRREPASSGAAQAKPERFEFPLLSAEQINLMRVFEIDMTKPIRLVLKREIIERFTDTYAEKIFRAFNAEQRAAYVRSDPKRIVQDMFTQRAREFYSDIQVLENPPSLKRFRDDVHRTWLSNGCATSQCHGGEDAGRLWLYSKKSGSDEAAFTNLLIIDRYRTAEGRALIDYEKPSRSLLLQYGLPAKDALNPHPSVPNFGRTQKLRPIFKGEDDADFIAAMEWISAMTRPHVDYPIDYAAPSPRSTRQAEPDTMQTPQPR